MLQLLDRYKFGVVAVFATYMVIFVYSNAATFTYTPPTEPFLDQAQIIDEDDEEITPDDVEVPPDFEFNSDAKNMSQNVHDERDASLKQYSENRSPEQIAKDIKALEAQMKDESGGSAKRAALQKLIDQRKAEKKAVESAATDGASNLPASENKYAGTTMVSYDLNGRKAHNNNDWFVRNPGYTCDGSNGVVVVNVKANKAGDVISAQYNESASRGASQCMINQALAYAKKSRFMASSESKHQTGYIKYTFVLK
ncbi:MAG: hypothetical protein Crog4KO_31340 [Crocinitomicaceae bacterium]